MSFTSSPFELFLIQHGISYFDWDHLIAAAPGGEFKSFDMWMWESLLDKFT